MFVFASSQQGGSNAVLYLVFALGSPLMIGGNVLSDRLAARRKHRAVVADFEAKQRSLVAEAKRRRSLVEGKARFDAPGPHDMTAMVRGHTSRVWERALDDDDFLTLRLGLHDTQLTLGFDKHEDAALLAATNAHGVAATVNLRTVGAIGVHGDREPVSALTHWLAVQVCVLHSPADVGIVVVAPQTSDAWQWLAWVPHTRATEGSSYRRLVAADSVQACARLDEVLSLIRSRRVDEQAKREGFLWPAVVVFIDGLDAALSRLIQSIIHQGPPVHVYAVVLVSSVNQLPTGIKCRVAIRKDGADIQLPDGTRIPAVATDGVNHDLLDEIALGLAPLRDVGVAGGGPGGIPRRVRMEEILEICKSADGIVQHWGNGSGASTVVPIGIGAGGTVSIDLSGQNTNALVAGTIGSGKSELLQTLVAALAVSNRPDRLNFVLVDFKGGTAFKDAKNLPHVVGMLANLDGVIVERAIRSLRSEAKRRQELLRDYGVASLDDYWAKTDNNPSLPRIMVVIDEFAQLSREYGDLLDEFVSIASIGRALGMHLILATQSPQGIVSEKIRANVGVRVCLRVAKPDESRDVIEVSDAASLDNHTPGRALLRTGSQLTECQTAWVGWVTAATEEPEVDVPIHEVSFRVLGATTPARQATWSRDTDLNAVVQAVRSAAARTGVRATWRPWTDELPLLIGRSDSRLANVKEGFVIGLEDLPEAQSQAPFVWEPESGPLLLVGANGSGRSTALQTIAFEAARTLSPDELNLYGIDGSPQSKLAPLEKLPHTGAIVPVADWDRLRRLVNYLQSERARRFSGRQTNRLLLLINHAERLLPDDSARVDFDRIQLLTDLVDIGTTVRGCGIAVAVSTSPEGLRAEGDGWRSAPTRLVLPLASADDYYRVEEGVRPPIGKRPPGRA
ncbi:MAG TPA: FtsK/SpoIIIE domain-containing protein, partial [Acidimicrobiales bacterium]|nr:FtsK/SpoIIIE domain-containing protein [Acidimicrobiales bacterium]